MNTFEPYSALENNSMLHNYVDNMYKSLIDDIETYKKMLEVKLAKRIAMDVELPKAAIKAQLDNFDEIELRAYQVYYHLLPENKIFNTILENLFVKNHLSKMLKKQDEDFQEQLIKIRRQELITVNIVNDIDLCSLDSFHYTSKNILSANLKNLLSAESQSTHSSSQSAFRIKCCNKNPCNDCTNRSPVDIALSIFRSDDKEWGIKTLADISKGKSFSSCVDKTNKNSYFRVNNR